MKEARYLPVTMSSEVTGSVTSVSILPLRCSSLNTRMVSAGIKKLNVKGSNEKKFLSSARCARKNVAKKKHPEKIKNSAHTMYAIGLVKYAVSSRFIITTHAFCCFTLLELVPVSFFSETGAVFSIESLIAFTSRRQRSEHVLKAVALDFNLIQIPTVRNNRLSKQRSDFCVAVNTDHCRNNFVCSCNLFRLFLYRA